MISMALSDTTLTLLPASLAPLVLSTPGGSPASLALSVASSLASSSLL